jgi:RecQ family ATP-dependent DNA helicase
MRDSLLATLHLRFGLTTFRPGQAEAITHLLAGRHTLVVMPTGAGKSLIYQLAALHQSGVTIVLSPLIALMKDQVDNLTRRNIPATYINSMLSSEEQTRRLRALAAGVFQLVYIAPERLRSLSFRKTLEHLTVSLLAVDEAHCISQWGHDFRPAYLQINTARLQLGNPLTVALTATATAQVQDDIVQLIGLSSAHRVVTGFNRPNLSFTVRDTLGRMAKQRALKKLFSQSSDGAALVYVGARREAERVAAFLREECRVQARHYHAKLDSEVRSRIQEDFLSRKLPVVVATNAFGMGIDRPDVRLVVHWTLPGTLNAYYQEAGRAGRDEKAARAVLLYDPADRDLQEWFIDTGTPTPADVRTLYDTLRTASTHGEIRVRLEDLARTMQLPEVKMRVALQQLENAGAIHRAEDDGFWLRLRCAAWNAKAMQTIAADAERYRQQRRAELDRMIAYAEARTCRRRALLDYFGDSSAAEAPVCCDHCLTSHAASVPPQGDSDGDILDTVGTTARLFAQGLTPLQIATQRGLSKGTIYRHLARSISAGAIPLSAVVPETTAALVREAIAKIGEISALAPLKALLPPTIDYEQIRCVVESWKRERETVVAARPKSALERARQAVKLGEARSPAGTRALLTALQDTDGNVRRLAASALGKIGDQRAVPPLLVLLQRETHPQVRQYAIKTLGILGDPQACALLETIAADATEAAYVTEAARNALSRLRSPGGMTGAQTHAMRKVWRRQSPSSKIL